MLSTTAADRPTGILERESNELPLNPPKNPARIRCFPSRGLHLRPFPKSFVSISYISNLLWQGTKVPLLNTGESFGLPPSGDASGGNPGPSQKSRSSVSSHQVRALLVKNDPTCLFLYDLHDRCLRAKLCPDRLLLFGYQGGYYRRSVLSFCCHYSQILRFSVLVTTPRQGGQNLACDMFTGKRGQQMKSDSVPRCIVWWDHSPHAARLGHASVLHYSVEDVLRPSLPPPCRRYETN